MNSRAGADRARSVLGTMRHRAAVVVPETGLALGIRKAR